MFNRTKCEHSICPKFHFRVKGMETAPKRGRPTVFSPDEELRMHNFLLDCWFLLIPRTQHLFALDIQFKVHYEKKTVPFTEGYPGKIFSKYYIQSLLFKCLCPCKNMLRLPNYLLLL